MSAFPDQYKARLLQHSEGLLEVARVLSARHPDIALTTCVSIVTQAHLDATVALVFNSISIAAPVKPIR